MNAKAKIAAGLLVLSSPALLSFLGKWEGEGQNTVYADKLARGLPTVCKGITKYTSDRPVVVGEYWSDEECERVEKLVTTVGQLKLADCITADVSQNTFDSLTSHSHNFGVPSTCASRALHLINEGKLKEGCNALAHSPNGAPVWSYVKDKNGNPVFVQGLYNRRLDEAKLCATPD